MDVRLQERLRASLPLQDEHLTVRELTRPDLSLLSQWPAYPWPHDVFRFSFSSLPLHELDRVYEDRARRQDRIALVADTSERSAVGYVALLAIDWVTRVSRDMSVRIHPQLCGQGLGTRLLRLTCDWWFAKGMRALRLDVASTNQRAARCYLGAGFQTTGEFWRDAPELMAHRDSKETRALFGNGVDWESEPPKVRFFLMEARRGCPCAGSSNTG